MGQDSKIEWTDHTFNPWWGCTKVAPACDHCYAENWARRLGKDLWGPDKPRPVASKKYWREPYAWNAAAAEDGVRRRVFCASMADICEDRPDLLEPRVRLMELIERTPALDWLLLTNRPEYFERFFGNRWTPGGWPRNVVAMATAENQQRLERNVNALFTCGARRMGLSLEPLLERVVLDPLWVVGELRPRIDWVIVGGESGHKPRALSPEWARALRDQCAEHGVAFHFKQWGELLPFGQIGGECGEIVTAHGMAFYRCGKKRAGRLLDGRTHDAFPELEAHKI